MSDDPIVAEVRRIREDLASRKGYDLKAIFEDLMSAQRAAGTRLVHRVQKKKTVPAVPCDK